MFGKAGFVASLLVLGAMVMASVNTPIATAPISEPVATSRVASAPAAVSNINRFAPLGASSAGSAPMPAVPGSFHPSLNGRPTSMPHGQFNRSANGGFVGHPYGLRAVPGAGIPGFARPQPRPDPDADSDSDSDTNNDNDDNNNNNNTDDNDNSAIDLVRPYVIAISISVIGAIA